MAGSTVKSAYYRGIANGAPFIVVLVPFAMLFGVLATEAGLPVLVTMGFSTFVIAGAAQFAALQLMIDNAPVAVVLATALAVNLRMAMYSAALVPHLGAAPRWQRLLVSYLNFDQSYATSIAEYEARGGMSVAEKVAYFLGVASPLAPCWYAFTFVGAALGTTLPDWLAIDFAVPITFLAVLSPMLKSPAHIAAAVVSVGVALSLSWMPAGSGLLLSAAAAMAAGAAVEIWTERLTA